MWQPTQDKFIFRIVVNLTPAKVKKRSQKVVADLMESDIPRSVSMRLTKRCLLGFVNSQYDPMGLICPLLIILKINLRDLFGTEVDIGWDDPLSEDLHERWVKIITMFLQIGDIILDRAVRPHGVEDVPELIGFEDGSLLAYACAVYIRWRKVKMDDMEPDRYVVRLVCAKA